MNQQEGTINMEDLKDCSYQVKGSLSVKQGTVFNGDVPLMTFYAQSDSGIDVNAPCGKLLGKGGLLSFEGNAEESAKMFFEHVCKVNNETVTVMAEQNRLLRSSLNLVYSWANNWDSEFMNDPEWRNQDYPIIQAAVALPDLSTSILNKRDVKTLGEAVCVCEELLLGRSTFSTDEIFGIRCCIKEIERLAAEKEKSCK